MSFALSNFCFFVVRDFVLSFWFNVLFLCSNVYIHVVDCKIGTKDTF